MPQSFGVYGGQNQAGKQPWNGVWTPGAAMANLFSLYSPQMNQANGDFISAGPITIPTLQDGPIQVVAYNNLTLNHVLTVNNRCRGLIILCKSFTGGTAGGITMSGSSTCGGAAGQPWWPWYDLTIPNSIALTSQYMAQADILNVFRTNGYFIGDPVIWAQAMMMGFAGLPGVTGTLTPGTKILDSALCGLDKAGGAVGSGQYSYTNGIIGNSGAQGPGGGGAGTSYNPGGTAGSAPYGRRGCPWGGGAGGGSATSYGFGADGFQPMASSYGGQGGIGGAGGGGAGSPPGAGTGGGSNGGSGTGGVVVVITPGTISLSSGFVAQCNGSVGGAGLTGVCGGSGSGGGFQAWIRGTGQTLTNNGSRTCSGGGGGASSNGTCPAQGAAGGNGAVMDFQFSALGF